MSKFFTPEPLASHPLFVQFFFRFAPEKKIEGLFKENLPPNFFESAEFVDLSQAEAIILANNFTSLDTEARAYITQWADEAQKISLPLFVFSCGDFTDTLVFDSRIFVFRLSLYRSTASPRDIIIPTITEDIGRGGIQLRPKAQKPVVSFCGKAGFHTSRERVVSWTRRIGYSLRGIVAPVVRARIKGVFWRQWVIAACEHSPLITTNFILRKGFSGALQTIDVPPEQARKDFLISVRESDFVLAPKGDGNYSNRFLEALSMGRIPVLIDTDVVLPLEDVIDYSRVIVHVPMNRVADTPRFVRDLYDSLSEEEWQGRQRLAREIFEKYLRQDTFFRYYFNHLGSSKKV